MKLAQVNLPPGPGGSTFKIPEPAGFSFTDVGTLITSLLPYAMVLGGVVLLGMLILGGFELLSAGGNQEKTSAAAARIKNALVGFLLLFAVYWLAQIAQVLFKIQIL